MCIYLRVYTSAKRMLARSFDFNYEQQQQQHAAVKPTQFILYHTWTTCELQVANKISNNNKNNNIGCNAEHAVSG